MRPLIRADGLHPTLDCHPFIAEQLCEQDMRQWVGGILNAREMAGYEREEL